MEHSRAAYTQIVAGLRGIGYLGALLEENYAFGDWFTPRHEQRQIAAAAFGQTPVAYDSALIGIALAKGAREQALVNQYRALGAPILLEIDSSEIREWAVSSKQNDHHLLERCPIDHIPQFLASRAPEWRPDTFLRAKNIGTFRWSQQLELFSGLVPELEEQIQFKLDPLLRDTLSATKQVYRDTSGREPNESRLFKLVFWLLTAKVFRDRRKSGFVSLGDDPDDLLAAVAKHYRQPVPILLNKDARQIAARRIWSELDFRNLSVEVLAHIWSSTLIDPETMRRLGIYRTSRSIVRYIVEQIPFETSGDDERIILEPCAGSAAFLIGAMNVLRNKWFGMTPEKRHEYFVSHLFAFEKDPLGVEISTLALTLADFPNANGWDVRPDDVFRPGAMTDQLRRAGVVLCNPPFSKFTDQEMRHYDAKFVRKPAELLHRILLDLHPQGSIGIVLPQIFIDGREFSDVRKRLAARFANLQVTALPDRAFDKPDVEIAVLVCTDPIPHNVSAVMLRRVSDSPAAWKQFELFHAPSSQYSRELTPDEAKASMNCPDLPEVWDFLKNYPRLGEHTIISRGGEWNKPLRAKGKETGNRSKFVRDTDAKGYMRGVAPLTSFSPFEVPQFCYLSLRREDERMGTWQREWTKPKAIVNKSARSRGAWRMSAFADHDGVAFYQTYTGVWPTSDRYDEWLLAAILNSPVANAFVATREGKTDITKETLEAIPIPRFTEDQATKLRALIGQYQDVISTFNRLGPVPNLDPEQMLKEIDALVLSAYHMPPRIERELLDFFNGHVRRTPYPFSDYFPKTMEVYFSLSEYLSPDFAAATTGSLRSRLREDEA